MKDRLITIVLSVAATMGLLKAEPERIKELGRRSADCAAGADRVGHGQRGSQGMKSTRLPAASTRKV